MRKVKITLPATVTNLGPGLNSLGLALRLHTTVEITERRDETLQVEPTGEGAGYYSVGLRHPVVLGLMRVFQRLERTVLGLNVRIDNNIPLSSGLGAETVLLVAGVIAANNLLDNAYPREEILRIAAQITKRPDCVVTAILGGLTASLMDEDELIYRSLRVTALKVVVVLPELDTYAEDIEGVVPERALLDDVLYNLGQIPPLIEALRDGNMRLLGQVMNDRLRTPYYEPFIPGYDDVLQAAYRAGATAVTLSENGPAMVLFAEANHKKLADAVQAAFAETGVQARTWVLPVDTQGVVISVAQSS